MADDEDLRAAETRPVLDAWEIAEHYDGVTALDRASLPVHEGQIHALLRGSDVDKSRLISMISDATKPDDETFVLKRETREPYV